MITPEQAADLRVGDVIRYAGHPELNGATVEGPLFENEAGELAVGCDFPVRDADGDPYTEHDISLAIVTRAARPLYVNHHREHPVNRDAARDDNTDSPSDVWLYWLDRWWTVGGGVATDLTGRTLRLLVDGETGMAAPQ